MGSQVWGRSIQQAAWYIHMYVSFFALSTVKTSPQQASMDPPAGALFQVRPRHWEAGVFFIRIPWVTAAGAVTIVSWS